ncbi:MAG TPA: hypothetical protein VFG94_04260 [Acidimicrobiales bacterium]|nr:hypothetical protein [Acidimicrobiales bacterium]
MPRGERVTETIAFTVEDLGPVVAVMAGLEATGGWLTLQPAFDAESAPPPRRGAGFFTARGPYIPVCNWVPGERTRQGIAYTALGIQHGAGGPVVALLDEREHTLAPGWEVIADHPARGLVVAIPPADDHARAVGWLLDAADLLCAVQLTGEWQATVHRR